MKLSKSASPSPLRDSSILVAGLSSPIFAMIADGEEENDAQLKDPSVTSSNTSTDTSLTDTTVMAGSSPGRSPSSLGHCQPGHPHSWQPQQYLRQCSSHGHIPARSCRTQCSSLSRWGHHHSVLCGWGHHHSVLCRWGHHHSVLGRLGHRHAQVRARPRRHCHAVHSTASSGSKPVHKDRSGQYVPMKELLGDNMYLRPQLEALPTHQQVFTRSLNCVNGT